jgi:hypothetical protein
MSQFYTNLGNTAARLMKKFGQQITFTRTIPGTYDPALGERTDDSSKTFKGYGVLLDFEGREVDGTRILSSDVKLLLESTKLEPQIDDLAAAADGTTFRVVRPMPLKPGGVNVITQCQLRIVGDQQLR